MAKASMAMSELVEEGSQDDVVRAKQSRFGRSSCASRAAVYAA
jgi:hypothetical protein